MNKYPAKPLMDEMAKHGRYGDSMLVHMHPAEVAGLASLVPGGRLPRNPVTGQPEAFYFLLPMLMNAAGASLTALQAAAVTGAASAIGNKDLGKGLLDGITAGATAGIGDAISGALDAGTNAVTQGVTEGASQAATEVGAQTAQELASQIPQIPVAGDIIEGTVLPELPAGTITNINPSAVPGASGIELDLSNLKLRPENISAQGVEFGKQGTDITKMTPSQFTERVSNNMNTGTIQDILQKPPEPNLSFSQRLDKGIKGIGTMGQLGIAGVAQGTKGDMEMREEARRRGEAFRAEGEAVRKEAFDNLQAGYIASGVPTGLSPARSEMSRYQQPPMYAAGGGQVRGMEEGGVTNENPYANQYSGLGVARDIARFMGGPRGYMGVDPVNVQQRLRGQDVVAPPRDYMPGFEPEFQYFQNLTRDPDGNIVGTPDVPDRGYRPLRQGVISRGQYFDPILQAPQSSAQMNEFRRTLEKLDPGPLGEAAVMGLASEGSVLSPMQQNAFEQYAPLAPFNTAQRGRISELMDRGMSVSQAIGNQESSRSKGYDLDGDGVVTDAEFTQATAEPETPDVPDYAKDMSSEQQAMLAEYMEQYGPDTGRFLTSLLTGGLGSIGSYMAEGGEAKKMPEVGPAPTGGDIPIRTSMMEGTVPDGGIARVPTEFTQQAMPSEQEMSMLAMAVLGQTENPDPIINMFVDKHGPDMFRQVRQMILESVVPNAQTEGMVRGNGSGMDDRVQGMIGKDQPVAVSPGEYIVAADVVSGLGEGSSDAGAKELDRMMDKVRMERNGTTQQAPRINERKVMPA